MFKTPNILATPWSESSGLCDCCGRESKTIWGDLSDNNASLATYFIQWAVGAPEHKPNIDLIIGAWGEGTSSENRVLVSLLFKPDKDGGAFMIIDSESRYPGKQSLCHKAMRRKEIVGTAFATEVFTLIDALWLTDPRISELKALNELCNNALMQ